MKEQIKDNLTIFLWILLLMFSLFIMGTFLSPEVKGAQMVEQVDKNPSLKKYHKKQKQMSFKGYKKRKQWKHLRK